MTENTNEGVKFDDDKDRFDLLPFDALAAIQKVLEFGARKYEPRNWEKGMAWKRPWNAVIRHLWAWIRGEKDHETGFSPLWHAGCEILFLISFELRRVGTDNRDLAPEVTPRVTVEPEQAVAVKKPMFGFGSGGDTK